MPLIGRDRFLLLYATLTFSTVLILTVLQEDRINVYVALFAVEYFVATQLTSPFSYRSDRRKTIMALLMLAIFSGTVVQEILKTFGR